MSSRDPIALSRRHGPNRRVVSATTLQWPKAKERTHASSLPSQHSMNEPIRAQPISHHPRGTKPITNVSLPAQHNGTKPCLSYQHHAYKERTHYTTQSPQEQERTQRPSHSHSSLHGTNPMVTTSSSQSIWNEAMLTLSAPPLARNKPDFTQGTQPFSRNEPNTLYARTNPCLVQPIQSPLARNEPIHLSHPVSTGGALHREPNYATLPSNHVVQLKRM